MNIRTFRGLTPSIGKSVYVDPSAVIIGDVSLADSCSVWPMAVIRGDVNRINIGAQTNIQDGAILHVTHDSEYTPGGRPLVIGEYVTVGHAAVLHACQIGNNVLIGMNSTVLDGAVIEDQVMLAAGSMVPPGKHLKSGYLYVGSPAIAKRPLSEKECLFLKYSAENYVKLANEYADSIDF